MSFTALSTGGLYKHNHGYAIYYGEYFGSINDVRLQNTTLKGVTSWISPIKSGSISIKHPNINSSSDSNADGYETNSLTGINTQLNVPFIAVYFWRKTA